jgi:hypothetical protein
MRNPKETVSMLFHTLKISVVTAVGLLLSSCSDSTPASPTDQSSSQPELAAGAHRPRVAVELHRQARLINDADGSLIVRLQARCPAGFQAFEGVVSVQQGPLFGEVFGEGFFTTRCTGHWRQERVRVVAPEGLHPGTAKASASLDVHHPETGEFDQGSDNEIVRIR